MFKFELFSHQILAELKPPGLRVVGGMACVRNSVGEGTIIDMTLWIACPLFILDVDTQTYLHLQVFQTVYRFHQSLLLLPLRNLNNLRERYTNNKPI